MPTIALLSDALTDQIAAGEVVQRPASDLTEDQLPTTAAEPVEVSNLAREPRLCGEVLLVERPPLPWAWAHARGRAALPTRYARLTVRC